MNMARGRRRRSSMCDVILCISRDSVSFLCSDYATGGAEQWPSGRPGPQDAWRWSGVLEFRFLISAVFLSRSASNVSGRGREEASDLSIDIL